MSTAIELVNMAQKAEAEMAPVLARAAAFVVSDIQSYEAADAICAEIKMRVKDRDLELGPPKEAATKAWKAMVALFKKYVDEPLAAVQTLDRKRYQWKKAEDARRAAEAEALRQEEIRKAEAARKVEAVRIALEAKQQADEALALAERLKAANMTEQADAVLEQAGQAEAEGVKQAEAIIAAPVAPTTVIAPMPVAKPAGQTQSENWTGRVVDLDLVPRELCSPDPVKINRKARLLKSRASDPGIVYEDTGKTTRRGL